jgi:HSP20 family protein
MSRNLFAQWSMIQRKLSGLSDHLLDPHSSGWAPNTDVFEGKDDIVVKMEVAGVDKTCVRAHLEEQAVIIEGMRQDPAGGESSAGYRFVQMEIEYGPFRRIIPLPFPVDGRHASARMDNGILRVRLPRARTNSQKVITITMET